MKSIYLSLMVCITVAIASCAKKADVWERTPVNEVKLLSFGFYEEDNPDVLVKDYIASEIKGSNITLLLPPEVDRSSLVARFTVGNNNIINVLGNVQKSGQTSNDFTVPVDYYLSNGNNNARYTISIGKGDGYIWGPVPFTINDSATLLSLKVNPVTGNPYITYNQSRATSADQKLAMARFENNQWVDMGAISDGRIGGYFDFTFDNNGVPYASYPDYTATVAQQNTVMKSNGGASWSLVGNKGFTAVRISYNALAFNGDGSQLLSFGTVDVAGGPLTRRELGVATFDNNTWIANTTIPGRSSALYGYLPVAKRKNNALYVGVFNASSPNSVSVYKYANNTWTVVFDQWREGPTGYAMNIRDFDMEVDAHGNVYIAFADNSSGVYKYRIIRYTEATQTVSQVGSLLAGASGNLFSFDLALSPLGVPYLFHRNASNYPTVVSFDSDTQDWTSPHILESEAGDELSMDFAPNGEAYIAYLKNKKFFVHKYSAP